LAVVSIPARSSPIDRSADPRLPPCA
jgi:hypothetical protein